MMLRAGSTGTEVNQGRHIIGTETFPRCQGDVFGLFHKVLGAVYMVWGLTNQGFKDFGKFLSHTIGDRSTARYYRSFVEYQACGSWGGHRTWGDTACGVHGLISVVI